MIHRTTFEHLFWEFLKEHPDNCVCIAAREMLAVIDQADMDWKYILKVAIDVEHGTP